MTAEVVQSAGEQQAVPVKKSFDVLNVIAEKVPGTVKWFSVRLHYGFIQRDDNREDVFVHRTAITASRMRYPTLRNGEPVEFSVVETSSGVNAASVTGPNGKNVLGARFNRNYRRPVGNADGHRSANGSSRAGGDAEGTRQRGGLRSMRRGRRNFRPSQNGMGDGENVAGGSIEQSEDQVAGPEDVRQRPHRYRGGGGRGRGNQRSTSNRQPGGVNGEEGGITDDSRPRGPPRRGGGRFRRGGRMRRDGRNGPQREGNAHVDKNEERPELKAENLETEMESMSLGASEKPIESTAAAHQQHSAEAGSGDALAESAEGSN